MMPVCDLMPIVQASDNMEICDLEGLLKYMSSYHLNDKSQQDRGDYLPLVHMLKDDIDKRKVHEYGYFAYA